MITYYLKVNVTQDVRKHLRLMHSKMADMHNVHEVS